MTRKLIVFFLLIGVLSACSGIRKSGGTFSAHAESFRVLGYPMPADDQQRAYELVPPGAKIETVQSSPADWSSVLGVLGNILWIGGTQISGTLPHK